MALFHDPAAWAPYSCGGLRMANVGLHKIHLLLPSYMVPCHNYKLKGRNKDIHTETYSSILSCDYILQYHNMSQVCFQLLLYLSRKNNNVSVSRVFLQPFNYHGG